MAYIQLQSISYAIGEKEILHSVDIEIREGEFFFLLGPSGSGKTTLLRVLAGFNQPQTGDIYLKGNRINDLPPQRRNFGMVFQSYALFPHMTVAENIAYGLKVRSIASEERMEKIKKSLEKVGLPGYEKRMPGSLSGV